MTFLELRQVRLLLVSFKAAPGFLSTSIVLCFLLFELLHVCQLVDLLLNADWSTYFAEHGYTTSKYSRVSPQDVARILEK